MLTQVAVLLVLILGLSLVLRRPKSQLTLLPCAPQDEATVLWGHEYRSWQGEIGEVFLRWASLLGPTFRIKSALFRSDLVIMNDTYGVNHIFQNAYQYVKSEAFLPVIIKTGGRGIIVVEGDEHKALRKMLYSAFTSTAVKEMADDVLKCADKCVSRMNADIQAMGNNEPLNMAHYFSACTLETIALVGFGQNFSHETAEAKAISESWRNDVQNMSTFAGFLAPIMLDAFPWITKLPIAALQEDAVAKKIIISIGERLLDESKVDPDGKNILSILMKESGLTKDQMLQNIVSFVMAGHETTAGTLDVTIMELARNINQDIQTKLRQELQAIDLADYGAIENLEYLDAVVREGLRLHPTARDSERIAIRDDIMALNTPVKLSNGETITHLEVKAGDRFLVCFTLVNTNPAVWGPDALEFKPERWIVPGGVPPANELPHGPYGSISSFADGPRVCIGWRLALMELKTILAFMIKSFEFKETGKKIEKKFAPVLQTFVEGQASQMPVYVTPVA